MLNLAAGNTIAGVAGSANALAYTITGMELSGGTETYKILAQGLMPTTASTLYTVPSATAAFVRTILIANITSSSVSGTMLYVNGTGNANRITPSLAVPANGALVFDASGWKTYNSDMAILSRLEDSRLTSHIHDGTSAARFNHSLLLELGADDHTQYLNNARGDARYPHFLAHRTSSVTITTAEAQVIGTTLGSNYLQAGMGVRFMASGVMSNSTTQSTWTVRVRIGSASLSGTVVASGTFLSGTTSRTNAPCMLEAMVTVLSAGSSGTAIGNTAMNFLGGVAGGTGTTSSAAINTTQPNVCELTLIGATGTPSVTVTNATIEVIPARL